MRKGDIWNRGTDKLAQRLPAILQVEFKQLLRRHEPLYHVVMLMMAGGQFAMSFTPRVCSQPAHGHIEVGGRCRDASIRPYFALDEATNTKVHLVNQELPIAARPLINWPLYQDDFGLRIRRDELFTEHAPNIGGAVICANEPIPLCPRPW